MRLWKLFIFVFILNSLLVGSSSISRAFPSFSTDYTILYDVAESGQTHVGFKISQKNNLSTVYATSFSLSLSQTNLSNIVVKDASGPLNPEIKTTDNITNINFDFIDKVVGKDKVNQFSVDYDSQDIANKQGSIWEINIPKLETNENMNSLTVGLRVPASFGQPAYIDPKPAKIDGSTYYFNSASLANKSISAVFGSTQYFKLNLTYHLNNPLDTPLTTQIAIPPQTPYQEIYIKNISPTPKDIQVDPDGNWLAAYSLKPNSGQEIKAEIYVKLSFSPRQQEVGDPSIYLRPTKYWLYDNPEISTKAKDLNTAKSIYDFVTGKLQYSYDRVGPNSVTPVRQGAVWAIENPLQAICTEYTDLFIALARANQIPARELQGFALSNNEKLKPINLTKDVLHSWPEYYSKERKTWIQIDPTWGSTTGGIDYFNKLDLNHIVFAIHGLDPNQPLPAGAYKNTESNSKDVEVEVVPSVSFPNPQYQIQLINQDQNRLYFRLTNISGVAGTAHISISPQPVFLAPLSSSTIEVKRNGAPALKPEKQTLIIDIDGQKVEQQFISQPYFPPGLLWGGAVFLAGGFAFAARSLYFRRRRQKPPIHW